MDFFKRKSHTAWSDPKLWVLGVAVILFIVVARRFFMEDAALKNTSSGTSYFIFFKQDTDLKTMPVLLKKFGAKNCETVGGGMYVYDCRSTDAEQVIQKAQAHEAVFDAMYKETVQ